MPWHYGASLALVLCMATNLQYLDLGKGLGGMTRTVLRKRWWTPGDVYTAYPFCKLKSLRLRDGCGAPLLPELEEQRLENVGCSST
jgi:hypothetical protein